MDVKGFLSSFENKTEKIKDLLLIYINRVPFRFATLFLKKNNISYYLIDHVHKSKTDHSLPSFDPINNLAFNFFSNDSKNLGGYKSSFKVNNIFIHHIKVDEEVIGVLCLGNKNSNIVKKDIHNFSDLNSLIQLIVNKHKLIEDYKKIYDDTTYFSKDLFLANLSHEIRTPLNGIIGYNQLLTSTNLNSRQKEYLSSISLCSVQLLHIINDIIDFSKLSSGQMKIQKECFSVSEEMDNIYRTMKERIRNKKHSYKVKISNNVPQFIILDKGKFIQIIINLLSNAIKYTPIGGNIHIKISNKDNVITIKIEDNGIGISQQDQCKLFNSFTQIKNSLTKTGTGLGLAISKRLVELLGGNIKVQSTRNIGSTFTFTCQHECIKTFEKTIIEKSKKLKDKLILIVDDNLNNRITLSDMIFSWKMQPIVCASAQEAIKLIEADRYKFDAGLIDICMPDINGVDLAQKIKENKPILPLIALSSVSGYVNLVNFDAKLDKPVNRIQLFNILYRITNKKQVLIEENFQEQKTTEGSLYKMKILIAEDVPYNLSLLKNMLKSMGFIFIETAIDGYETITKIREAQKNKDPFTVLLLDLRMPKVDGYEVIDYITKEKLTLPKIIAVTASVLQEEKEKCKKMGVKYFVTKPINMTDLQKVMHQVSFQFS